MLNRLLFLLTITFCIVTTCSAQTPSGVNYPVASCVGMGCPAGPSIPTFISASYFDTINEVLYVAGPFNDMSGITRNGLAAINAVNGTLLSWAPIVNNGIVKAIAKSGDTIFVGGTFSQINGISRGRIAAISASTGLLLNVFTTGTGNVNDTIIALQVFGSKLYVGGRFTTIASAVRTNIARLSYGGMADTWIPAVSGPVKKFGVFPNNIAALTQNYALECSDIFSVSIASGTATLRAQSDQYSYISDFAMRGTLAFMGGSFFGINANGNSYTACCNLTSGAMTSWNPVIPVFNWNAETRISVEYYRDSLYLGVFDASAQLPAHHRLYVSHYNSVNNLRVLKIYQSNLTGLNGYYNDNLLVGNARLIEVERYAQHTSFPDGAINCKFYSYCLPPPLQPGPFTIAATPVCPGDSNVIYAVTPLGYFSTYTWSDNSIYATETGTTNSCTVDFTESFNGIISIRATGITSCGIASSNFRATNVSRKPPPFANAGADDSLNCIVSSVMLHGSSLTAGSTYSWNGPSGNSNSDSILATLPGNYELIVHGPNGCWKRDTAVVVLDTVRPAILPFGTIPDLTCSDTLVQLDAGLIYPGDSLFWSGPGLTSNSNPAGVNQSANFLLVVTNRNNGCSNTDTIFVGQDYSPPAASIVASDTLFTCIIQNILLYGNSPLPGVAYQWSDTSGTFFADPFSISVPGAYQLHATDSVNGCVNSANLIFISSWTTPPGINSLPDTLSLNCSYSAVQLNAGSLTSGALLNWTGPNSYSSANPGNGTQTGYYFVNAIHPQNGCESDDSVFVDFQNVLDLNSVNDTAICFGSGAVLQTFPVGGTSPFVYSWNNNAGNTSLETVYPNDTLEYIVSVVDGAGCSGTDTVIVNVPDAIDDSTLSFQPCDPLQPTGQIQVYAFGGVAPFQYSSDNGISWNATGVFPNLAYGTYYFLIRDFLGCTKTDTAIIDTNSLSPSPDFLVSTGPQQGDTIVVVDISNPRPDSVSWDFPASAIVTDSNMFAPAFINGDTGVFNITMHAFYGSCEVIYSRAIHIHPFDSLVANAWNNNGIDSIVLYPNPNNGVFNLDVVLHAKQNFVILVYDASGVERARQEVFDTDQWSGQMIVPNPIPGNFVLRVIAEYDTDQQLFVITQ
ncbi:MAG: hypothetical protein M3R17_14825 [Bacteroidota bacterium]|nr:hypothetical protein [Bacteroidota bacterium]